MPFKKLYFFSFLIVVFTFSSCAKKTVEQVKETVSEQIARRTKVDIDGENDKLVIYFSKSGNTEAVADIIAKKTGADLWKIELKLDNYPETMDELLSVTLQEKQENKRPSYLSTPPYFDQYKTIFIGSPVWHNDWPMVMYTFFDINKEHLADKILVPFCTYGGGESTFVENMGLKLHKMNPTSTVKEGFAVVASDGKDKKDEVSKQIYLWLKRIGY